jgi:predicted pyridoxine 5'-phosphate oxidase superfamily flavin-nucleotide-binding protein
MAQIDEACQAVLNTAEWAAIATNGPDGPHAVAAWGDYVRTLGIRGDRLIIPAGHYEMTEKNLKQDNRVEVLFAVRPAAGQISGCCVHGRAEFQTSGEAWERVHANYEWARAALVVKIESVRPQS